MVQTTCHAHKLKRKPEQFGEEAFDKIFDIARISRFTLEERLAYEADMRNERNQYAIRMTAMNEGVAIGEARGKVEGIAIGENRGRNEILDLMTQGYNHKQIKDILKLS